MEIPNWKAGDYMAVQGVKPLPLSTPELLTLSYLKHTRDHVVRNGFSYLGSFAGRHRSGKSIAATTFGYLWDTTFYKNMESRFVQDHKEFIDVIDGFASQNLKGGVIVVDEAGVSMASSDWYEVWMKSVAKMVQMFGYLHPIVLFVAPMKDFVDSRLRKMFHAYYELDRYNNNYSVISPYEMKYSTIRSKYYHKKPIITINNQEIQLRRIMWGKPPQHILDRYANIEQSRKPELLENFKADISRSEVKDQKKEVDLDKTIGFVVKNYKLYESKRSKPDDVILDENKIEFGHRIPQRMAKYIKGEAQRQIQLKYKEVKKQIEEKKD